ncbi:hypothetical protein [Polaribacter filamentus]|jgi:hypothetical protein|nr:hypothetical protein [Polaribacter filamentus]
MENFPSKLNRIDFETLENGKHSIYGLSEDLKLIYENTKWINFAQ